MPTARKLRCPSLEPPLHVVLVEPEIPPNTGAIARTCAATGSILHLIEPLGFRIDDQAVRRAGLDYWHLVKLHVHPDFEAFRTSWPELRLHLFTANTGASYLDAGYLPGDALVFGKESVGLPQALLQRFADRCLAIPTSGAVRSLNLSNAVSIAVFEALRQCGTLSQSRLSDA